MLCSSENNLVVERSVCGAFIDALERSGAAVVQPNEALQTRETLFDPIRGNLCRKILGQPPERVAKLIGLKRDKPIDLIVVPASREELGGPLGREKMAPVLSLFTAETFEDALALSCQLLNQEGAGHTAVIHSSNTDNIQRFATSVPASRVIANTAAGMGVAGVGTGLVPSFTLGCGTMGGSSTSDNVTYTHVRNIKRLAYPE
jgi:acyl-CoA reductase-like NAD-dependent aldehyde dehydrogenase